MKHAIILAVAVALSGPAFAGRCTASDAWTGPDKTKHLAAGFSIAAGVTAASGSPRAGFLAGVAVGAAKEVYDARHPAAHTCSLQDFLVTTAGAAAGAAGVGWLLLPKRNGVVVAYAKEF